MRAGCLFDETPSPLSSSEGSQPHHFRKRMLLAVFLVVVIVLSIVVVFQLLPPAYGAIALQPCSGKGTAFSGSTISVTMNATPTSGDVLVLCSGWEGNAAGSTISSVATTTGVTWTSLGNPQAKGGWSGGTQWVVEIWYGVVGSSATTDVLVTYAKPNGAWGGCVDVYEFSGLQTTYGFLDNNASQSTGSGSILSTGRTATTGNANDLFVGCGFTNRGSATAAQTLYSNCSYNFLDGVNDVSGGSDVSLSYLYYIASSTQVAVGYTQCQTTGNVMVGCIATFKAAAAAFTASITVNTLTHSWTINPGDNNVTINENSGQISLTVTANANFDIKAEVSGALAYAGYTIPLSDTNMSASTWSAAIPLSASYQVVPGLSNVPLGTSLSESFYLWLSCPTNTPAGAYTWTLTVEVVQTGT